MYFNIDKKKTSLLISKYTPKKYVKNIHFYQIYFILQQGCHKKKQQLNFVIFSL